MDIHKKWETQTLYHIKLCNLYYIIKVSFFQSSNVTKYKSRFCQNITNFLAYRSNTQKAVSNAL